MSEPGWTHLRPVVRIEGRRTCWACWTSWTYRTPAQAERVNRLAAEHAKIHYTEDQKGEG